MTQPQRIHCGWKGLKQPTFLHVGNGRPYLYQGSLDSSYWGQHSHVLSCPIPVIPATLSQMSLSLPCSKVGVILACEFAHALHL